VGGEGRDYSKSMIEEFRSEFGLVVDDLVNVRDSTYRFLMLVAFINTFFERHGLGRIIISRGFAAEFYSGGGYKTLDVDIIVEGGSRAVDMLKLFLKSIGYVESGRFYVSTFSQLVEKALDIVGMVYDKPKSPVRLSVNNYYAYMIPPEEAIMYALTAAKYRSSASDFESAVLVYVTQRERLDLSYLSMRADEENVRDYLERVVKLLEGI